LRVLVTGANGQLGAAIVRTCADADVIAHTRASLDITDASAVARVVHASSPDAIVNCAAFNDVDGAESAPGDALAVNAFALRALARSARETGAALVHFSTDFVFDGRASEPYDEQSPAAPQSTYAASKLLGEWFALDAPRAYVLRVESLFGSPRSWTGRRGTLDGIVAGLESGRDVRVFTDRIVSPSYTVDVAAATRHLLETNAPSGVYHCVNDGHAAWSSVAAEAAAILRVTPLLIPMTMDQVSLRAARPRFCALSTKKLRATGFAMPTWQDALRRWLRVRAVPNGAGRSRSIE
jgi:dTDP-4-dehydrorhamnose reductase